MADQMNKTNKPSHGPIWVKNHNISQTVKKHLWSRQFMNKFSFFKNKGKKPK